MPHVFSEEISEMFVTHGAVEGGPSELVSALLAGGVDLTEWHCVYPPGCRYSRTGSPLDSSPDVCNHGKAIESVYNPDTQVVLNVSRRCTSFESALDYVMFAADLKSIA